VNGRRRQAGQILPLLGISLAVVLGFAGIGVDVGYLEYWQQQQQSATDIAALDAAEQLAHSSCASNASAQAVAKSDASANGFADGSNGISVVPNSPPVGGVLAGNGCAVSVAITSSNVSTFFSRLFGFNQAKETTQAVAEASANAEGAGCIYLLSPSVNQNFNGATVTAPQCGVLINDTANFNGATIDVGNIGYAGAAPNENGSHFSLATPAPMLTVADPCPTITGCAAISASPPPASSCSAFNGNGYSGSLSPGCYSNLNLNGATVTLNSGTYVLSGSSNFNGSKITGSGVTLYVTASGTPPNFNGAQATLSPPTTGSQIGVLYYQVLANTGSPNFNGTNSSFSGLIYAPGATGVNFNGANGKYVVLVFGGMNSNGSIAWDFASPAPGGALVKQAVLVQ
jgi:hypothetical protein